MRGFSPLRCVKADVAWGVAEAEAENDGEEEAAAERDEEQGVEAGVLVNKKEFSLAHAK